jgi:aspartate-semialdehyde dehydrogenase
MDASVATEIERAFAQAGHFVVSNSKNHRMEPDVPLLVPEINPEHLGLAPLQRRRRGWSGLIVTNPNCTTVVLALALAPLKPFGIRRVLMTSMQAISGAGYPGVPGMDVNANVIPSSAAKRRRWKASR